jgi:hypothetical protein
MKMNSKTIAYILLGVVAIVSWNVFLIQRDNKMFDRYEKMTISESINV